MPLTSDDSVIAIMHTCRAMRRFTSQDVPEEIIMELLDAAIRAPSGGNAQNWRFIVVRDSSIKRLRGAEVRRSTRWKSVVDELRIESERRCGEVDGEDLARFQRGLTTFKGMAEDFEAIPVLICVCVEPDVATKRAASSWPSLRCALEEYGLLGTLRFAAFGSRLSEPALWAAGYPAAQNILRAARVKGLGAVLTAPQLLGPPGRFERILALPKGVKLAGIIPIGYPKGRFGPVRRRPVESFVFRNRYGTTDPMPDR